jgi:hypothetical protein
MHNTNAPVMARIAIIKGTTSLALDAALSLSGLEPCWDKEDGGKALKLRRSTVFPLAVGND